MQFWLAVGTPENWHTAFDYNGIWGLKSTQDHFWDSLSPNEDIIFFYATRPVSGVVGYGIIRNKLRQRSPLWPLERAEDRVIWPLRFEFDVLSCLPPNSWKSDKVGKEELRPRVRGGFQALSADLAKEFMDTLPSSAPAGLVLTKPLGTKSPIVRAPLPLPEIQPGDQHARMQKLLQEIGSMQRLVASTEFPMEQRRLDVVWRRVQRSVPSHAFEVQIGGNLTEAVAKLKQASDLWNSSIFLVGMEEHRAPAAQLAGGTFHEIQSRLRFLEISQVEELYRRKLAYRQFEDQLGILGLDPRPA
jgi:hypothetical protein